MFSEVRSLFFLALTRLKRRVCLIIGHKHFVEYPDCVVMSFDTKFVDVWFWASKDEVGPCVYGLDVANGTIDGCVSSRPEEVFACIPHVLAISEF